MQDSVIAKQNCAPKCLTMTKRVVIGLLTMLAAFTPSGFSQTIDVYKRQILTYQPVGPRIGMALL